MHRLGPIADVLKTVDESAAKPMNLSRAEFQGLVEFVREGLTDPVASRGFKRCVLNPANLTSARGRGATGNGSPPR